MSFTTAIELLQAAKAKKIYLEVHIPESDNERYWEPLDGPFNEPLEALAAIPRTHNVFTSTEEPVTYRIRDQDYKVIWEGDSA